ncbi:MAG: hypothetical protein EOP49_44205, partial [Sphingobacteriales bacterium]
FHMGPSDEDPAYAFSARNRSVSISGFWMDATEITNNEYRQFVYWVRDSVAAKKLGAPYVKQSSDGSEVVDFAKMRTLKWNDPKVVEQLNDMILPEPDRLRGRKELDPSKIVYQVERFDLKEAAKRENAGKPRSQYIERFPVSVYPDTLVWMRDFSYSYNEPMTKRYFSHPAFGNYPVVGVNWKMAEAFCNWRTLYLNNFLESKNRVQESDFRLPTEAQWEYAARGGRSQSMFPWGNYYLRNKKGCLLANFKPGRGNYPVVGVNWKMAEAFCNWRTLYLNNFLESKNRVQESDFRLPTEAQWEYAARGGRSQSMFPWGNYYLRNKKGCLLANFKPGRGNYPEDGGFYTVRADAYWPNDYGLYNMSGNVAEWTSSIYYEGSYTFQHDMNPDVRFNAKDSDPP